MLFCIGLLLQYHMYMNGLLHYIVILISDMGSSLNSVVFSEAAAVRAAAVDEGVGAGAGGQDAADDAGGVCVL